MPQLLTLCIIHQDDKVLLGMKKRGFGAGRWNGFGGKVSKDESIESAAKREILEEAGVTVDAIKQVGILTFTFENNPETLEVHVFKATEYSGDPVETEEMSPKWFAVSDIPFDSMWADDTHWFPLFLEGKYFTGTFAFDEKGNTIVSYDLRIQDGAK